MTIELTPEIRAILIKNARNGKTHACRRVGIDRHTLSRWLKETREPWVSFAKEYRQAQVVDAEELIAMGKVRDPWKALSILHGIREPRDKDRNVTHRHQWQLPKNLRAAAADVRGLPTETVTAYLSAGITPAKEYIDVESESDDEQDDD